MDVVVQLNSTFQRDLSALPSEESNLYKASYSDATYLWDDFRADVLATLQSHYGSYAVTEGNKSIKVAGDSGRLPADVIPCLQHRTYERFRSVLDQRYVEGIVFYTRKERRRVINFPKPHYDNGVAKNKDLRTGGMYKPTVRMFKNARSRLVDQGDISKDLSPSYFLECFLYNAPDGAFHSNLQGTFVEVLVNLANANWDSLVCQNEQVHLFGNEPEQWSQTSAARLVSALIELWKDW